VPRMFVFIFLILVVKIRKMAESFICALIPFKGYSH
jgi:hypothetical protein